MKSLLTYIVSITFIGLLGGLLWSCDKWDLPTKKTKRECVKPSGNLTASAKELKVDFSITNATGTIEKVTWDFGGSGPNNTTVTTGLTASYTYPTSTTFSAKAVLSNSCDEQTTLIFAGSAVAVVKPVVAVQAATNVGFSTATVGFLMTNAGNQPIAEYGICYSSTANPPVVGSATTVPVTNPAVNQSVSTSLTNLASNTTYYYRSYVKLASGEIVYSSTTGTFTTPVDTLAQDLIASVSFTNGSLDDVSGYGNHVKTIGTTPTTDRNNKANSAILLNGSGDYFYMPESSSLNPEALTISLWIKPAAKPTGPLNRMQIYNKGRFSDGLPQTYSSLIRLEGDGDVGPRLTFMTDIKQGSNCQGGVGWQSLPFTAPVNINTWYHLVFTYSGRSARMYFNNTLVFSTDTLPYNQIDKCQGGELKFGAQYQSLPWYFNGAMDDIRMYKRALSASEVETLFKQ